MITKEIVKKDSYSREEVEQLMKLAWDKSLDVNRNMTKYFYSDGSPMGDFKSASQWIEQNL